MKIAYVKWRDASYSNKSDERPIEELQGTVELDAVGFLLNDSNEETVTLTMEHQDGAKTSRTWQVIPRVNIAEMRVAELEKAFPPRSKRKV